MTDEDRKLLIQAAYAVNGGAWHPLTHTPPHDGMWNPLDDDGDAFRLAVRLNLFHEYDFDTALATVWFDATNPDKFAATRRAIVLAAVDRKKTK